MCPASLVVDNDIVSKCKKHNVLHSCVSRSAEFKHRNPDKLVVVDRCNCVDMKILSRRRGQGHFLSAGCVLLSLRVCLAAVVFFDVPGLMVFYVLIPAGRPVSICSQNNTCTNTIWLHKCVCVCVYTEML